MDADKKEVIIRPEVDDAPEFARKVEALANGILSRYEPPAFILIKINNWFNVTWLRFSGKTLGVLGTWNNALSIPPFVPNRVVSQRRFSAPDYQEVDAGKPIHLLVESSQAVLRRVSEVAGGAALMWYSGGSAQAERGAVMAHVPVGAAYSPWYTGWAKRKGWELVQPKEISEQEIAGLIDP
jgi:hypothetical protein